jgi:GNAT superfamily N-acetyltransferase
LNRGLSERALDASVRIATTSDVPVLREVIEASVRGLQARDYTARQVELALKSVYGVDTRLIADGTYFAAEALGLEADPLGTAVANSDERPSSVAVAPGAGRSPLIVGCGGWSKRRTLFGGDQWSAREDDLLDPAREAAKIRAFFVHPEWARRGIGTMILDACEVAAKAAGFKRLEMGATLSGVPFYRAKGYVAIENVDVPLGGGEVLPIVRMAKMI